MKLVEATIVAELDGKTADIGGGIKHLTLQVAGSVPGGFPGCGCVHGEDQATGFAGCSRSRRARDLVKKGGHVRGLFWRWSGVFTHVTFLLQVYNSPDFNARGAVTVMDKLVVATSSSALFDLRESDRVYREEGVEAYAGYQIAREDEPLAPGDAFHLVQKLLAINESLNQPERVEVILLSRNTADTGLRVFNSIEHHRLPIKRAAFAGGGQPYQYMKPFGCQLFLSTHQQDVVDALNEGMAAASILAGTPSSSEGQGHTGELRFAFDGDAVLFTDQAERVYQEQGLEEFMASEKRSANTPLGGGPFKPFLAALHALQDEFDPGSCPIRTALVTARSAPAHERVIRTLRAWGIRLNESLFLGGMQKSEFLRAYQADVFFDDQAEHCRAASEVATTGHVPHGVINQP